MLSLDPLLETVRLELDQLTRRQREALDVLTELALPDNAAAACAELAATTDHLAGHERQLAELLAGDSHVRPLGLQRAIRETVALLGPRANEIVFGFDEAPIYVAMHRPHLELVLLEALRGVRGATLVALHPARERVQLEVSDSIGALSVNGIGVAIARSAARSYGGDLVCRAQSGVGTTFAITLPRIVGTDAARLSR